jgi:hypothetical protein
MVNPIRPDDEPKSLLRSPQATIVVRPGQTIIWPGRWWHGVQTGPAASIAIGLEWPFRDEDIALIKSGGATDIMLKQIA